MSPVNAPEASKAKASTRSLRLVAVQHAEVGVAERELLAAIGSPKSRGPGVKQVF